LVDIYLVGGAVRDELLGLPVSERDWVVVGATAEEMQAQGYRPVGKDFPVFLHPKTQEEYALARTERKAGRGYKGFQIYAAPNVTLEEDLLRRDLTINAMAKTEDGQIIDPYGGQADCEKRLLRHVSPAFVEDPLRVLRIARFAARFAHLGFQIADETAALLREMVRGGELNDLVPDRVWLEWEKALATDNPQVFIQNLRAIGALTILAPELDALFGVPNPPEYHPEVDSGVHTLMVLEEAARLTDDRSVRFAALVHDVGKAVTPMSDWPRHIGHDQKGLNPIKAFCQRYPVPNEYRALAYLVCRYHIMCHRLKELKPSTVLEMLQALDVFRRPERAEKFLLGCLADFRGRGLPERPYVAEDLLPKYIAAARAVAAQPFVEQGLDGARLGEAIRLARIEAIAKVKPA
jgi:tRNA nucleotidyltransferase (CCA-adding enzyme)